MNRSVLVGFLATVSLIQSAHAQTISDLPDLGDPSTTTSSNSTATADSKPTPPPPPTPKPTVTVKKEVEVPQREEGLDRYSSSVKISEVPRTAGGTLYTLRLSEPTPLSYVSVKVLEGYAKIHAVRVVSRYGGQEISRLSQTDVLNTGRKLTSEALDTSAYITGIEVVAESFKDNAALQITAYSSSDITLRLENAETQPQPEPPTQNTGSAITINSRVMYRYGSSVYYGTVKELFTNDANVLLDGYSSLTLIPRSKLFKAMTCFTSSKRLCKGEKVLVMTSSKYTGVVTEVYSDGSAAVLLDGYSSPYVYSFETLAKTTKCAGNICVDMRVLKGTNGYTGVIKAAYDNGLVSMLYDGYSSPYLEKATDLSPMVSSYKGYVKGTRVLTANGYRGVVTNISGNGSIAVLYDGYSSSYWHTADKLSKLASCINSFCNNDRVLTDSSYFGTVVEVFDGGQIFVLYDGYSSPYLFTAAKLAKAQRCSGTICTGDRVIVTNGNSRYTGTVKAVFTNSKASVLLDGYSSPYIYSLTSLSK